MFGYCNGYLLLPGAVAFFACPLPGWDGRGVQSLHVNATLLPLDVQRLSGAVAPCGWFFQSSVTMGGHEGADWQELALQLAGNLPPYPAARRDVSGPSCCGVFMGASGIRGSRISIYTQLGEVSTYSLWFSLH